MLLTRDDEFVRALPSDPPNSPDDDANVPLWTDQYSNLFRILKGMSNDQGIKNDQ